ncbi:MAG TPA: hypothetical protein VKT29_03620 [Terriglobales bacterium]|nr:hypothetical protein [Terriglobales bacterium]
MPPTESKLPCPFCHGQGKLSRTEIVARLEDPELPEKIVAELNRSTADKDEQVVLAGGPPKGSPESGDFAAKVHGWNRHVLWRRSSKE